ncbi:uncharacterized protein M421DRAFT_414864 [Didymella exigua CBS 183.55]|uniref:Uncharacterized protein n=1 Tax=Didymella exigua CBS 183.55 TaxID=1150837 RepID=A0A6A5S233_9PLEO|nr:uncharacterized protein M421DRAFT_414864 [Didymella exigua CBS 183.55]KAF1933809.1 hypothetical protein M421DRAFT_414864 [Didymella exigua CBS 183.55]
MLVQSTIIALLASAALVAGAAFPGDHDKYKTTCKAEYKTKTRVDHYKSTYYETKTKNEPYVTYTTKTYVTKTDVPYTTTKYETNTKYITKTEYETKKVPVTIVTHTFSTEKKYKTDKSTYVESKTSKGYSHKPITKTETRPYTTTKTYYETKTRETKVPTTKYETKTEQKCTTIKCDSKYGCGY